MQSVLRLVDRLIRGELIRKDQLAKGRIEAPAMLLVLCAILLGMTYGVFMGLYGVLRPENATALQMLASAAKVPLLFLLTLFVTVPSLYVFSALAGSRLSFADTFRLLMAGIVVNLAVLASFGPVTGFFTLSTESYAFMKTLNVVFFAIGGLAGTGFMWRALQAVIPPEAPSVEFGPEDLIEPSPEDTSAADSESTPSSDAAPTPPPAPRRPTHAQRTAVVAQRDRVRRVFGLWLIVYGAVGAQMGWILRPFIGSPKMEFKFFRTPDSNFFKGFAETLGQLFGG